MSAFVRNGSGAGMCAGVYGPARQVLHDEGAASPRRGVPGLRDARVGRPPPADVLLDQSGRRLARAGGQRGTRERVAAEAAAAVARDLRRERGYTLGCEDDLQRDL